MKCNYEEQIVNKLVCVKTPTSVFSPAEEDYLWVYKVSHMYYGLIAMAIAFIVGIVVSLITGYLI